MPLLSPESTRHSLRMVTIEGESLSPGGSMTGGAFKNNSNLLGRRERDRGAGERSLPNAEIEVCQIRSGEWKTPANRSRSASR